VNVRRIASGSILVVQAYPVPSLDLEMIGGGGLPE